MLPYAAVYVPEYSCIRTVPKYSEQLELFADQLWSASREPGAHEPGAEAWRA
eukprot:COSAG05_NODE_19382_length_293_cov_1.494845_1_plen_51_part_01